MLKEGPGDGIFERAELSMVGGLVDLGDCRLSFLMIPCPDIIGFDLDDPDGENIRRMITRSRSTVPSLGDDLDSIAGMVPVKGVLAGRVYAGSPDIRGDATKPFFVPESIPVQNLLESFKESGVHSSLVTDEYGSVQGFITLHGIQGFISLHGILQDIVGDVRSAGQPGG